MYPCKIHNIQVILYLDEKIQTPISSFALKIFPNK